MKTNKQIYDFVKEKLKETEEYMKANTNGIIVYGCQEKIKAYEEVLNFIGTIGTKGE